MTSISEVVIPARVAARSITFTLELFFINELELEPPIFVDWAFFELEFELLWLLMT